MAKMLQKKTKKNSVIHSASAKDVFLNIYIAIVVIVFKQDEFKYATSLEKVSSYKMSFLSFDSLMSVLSFDSLILLLVFNIS